MQQHFRNMCLGALVAVAASCSSGSSTSSSATPSIVVTYSALGDVVQQLVGNVAKVSVVIPNGQDQHDFSPSAKDIEELNNASFVVANGLNLEEGLADALAQTAKSGVPVFHIADYVTLRSLTAEANGHDGKDPHIWLDPETLVEAIPALTAALEETLNVDLSKKEEKVTTDLKTLSTSIRSTLSGIDKCTLVTGHDSLQYFAARYGCKVVGAVIPSYSTAAEASAGDLAALKTLAQQENVRVIFTELGTPADVAALLSKELGVKLQELSTHVLPSGGGYGEMMLNLASSIASGLK
ncbi:MAG: zinc ABC transporter substrate-binding protein [Actinobacteria bacterium]|nr:zinc ABC transporter substrate-binding protein [Actinomycetota bacterium]